MAVPSSFEDLILSIQHHIAHMEHILDLHLNEHCLEQHIYELFLELLQMINEALQHMLH